MGNKTRERGGPAPKGRRLPAGHSSAVSLARLADRESLQGNHFKAAINYASMLCRGGGRESRRPAFLPATQASSRPNNKLKGRHNKKKEERENLIHLITLSFPARSLGLRAEMISSSFGL